MYDEFSGTCLILFTGLKIFKSGIYYNFQTHFKLCFKVISIGFSSSFTDDKDVLIRKDMTKESGNDLIKRFLEKMEELKIKHYKSLSPKIQHSLKEYKALLKCEKNVEKKARLAQEFIYLKKLADA